MTLPLLVLRPQPGADQTAARARAIGLETVIAPLFRIVPRPWAIPAKVEALLVTSANAARLSGARPDRRLPVYAVGSATAAALREQGFTSISVGDSDVAAIVRQARDDGVRALLHLAGEDRTGFDTAGVQIDTRIVYAAEPVEPAAAFHNALQAGAVALIHSARAARRFRELAGTGHRIAAISPAVAAAAGAGWAAVAVAQEPNDDALLAAAAPLCH